MLRRKKKLVKNKSVEQKWKDSEEINKVYGFDSGKHRSERNDLTKTSNLI